MAKGISDVELRALVDNEIREAMGELSGELSNDRARAMDYYHGEAVGKLAVPGTDRSSAVLTVTRDSIEWLMPEMMRILAKADKIVEFEPVGQEDEEAAEQETQALNHIFWRQNPGFLILYSWIKDALIQKNGIVKWWLDESETKTREEHQGLTEMALLQMENDPELTAIERSPSDIASVTGEPLHDVTYERVKKRKRICVEVLPPEEALISSDCRSINIQEANPRFVGHFTEKTRTELLEMGFPSDAVDKMARGGGEFIEEWDQEYYARYRLTDEQQHIHGSTPHESQQKIKLVEGYMRLDIDGDDYAELVRIWRAGDYCEHEKCDQIPLAAITPNILTHKFYGMSIAEQVEDLQEIGTAVLRNVLDNMYQVNNTRPVANERVDIDSLLQSRPGAPIYVDDSQDVQGAVMPFAPPPMWKDGLQYLEWQDGARKDRIGVGDEVMGLDPNTLSKINTGVMQQALDAARGKIEIIARIFAETGIKWLFQGMHELARKSYDQPLRYQLNNRYVEVNPQEWRERTNMVANVGTATGSQEQELIALSRIGELQQAMIQAGGLGLTVVPSNVYEMAIDTAKALGKKDAEKYFFDPMMRANPRVMEALQVQMPQQQGDPNASLVQAQMTIEQGKAQVAMQKTQVEAQLKQAELMLKDKELGIEAQVERMKQEMQAIRDAAKNQTDIEKAAMSNQADRIDSAIKAMEVENRAAMDAQRALIDTYKAELQSLTTLQAKAMEIAQKDHAAVMAAEERVSTTAESVTAEGGSMQKALAEITEAIHELREQMESPKEVERGEDGRPTAIGGRPITYNGDGTIRRIG